MPRMEGNGEGNGSPSRDQWGLSVLAITALAITGLSALVLIDIFGQGDTTTLIHDIIASVPIALTSLGGFLLILQRQKDQTDTSREGLLQAQDNGHKLDDVHDVMNGAAEGAKARAVEQAVAETLADIRAGKLPNYSYTPRLRGKKP